MKAIAISLLILGLAVVAPALATAEVDACTPLLHSERCPPDRIGPSEVTVCGKTFYFQCLL